MLRIIYHPDEINSLIYSNVLKQKIFDRIDAIEKGESKVGTNLELIKNTEPKLYSARVDYQFRMLLTPRIINGKPYFRYLGLTPHNYNLPLILNHPTSVNNALKNNKNRKIENAFFTPLEANQQNQASENRVAPKEKKYLVNDVLRVEFYDDKWIVLNDKQTQLLDIVANKGLPIIVTGAPGSGKTMLTLMSTGLSTDAENVLFFPPSDDLLDDVQRQFNSSECSKVMSKEKKEKILFGNSKTLLSKYFSEDKIVDEKTHCQNWIIRQLEVKKDLKEFIFDLSTSPECINKIFSELRIISGFYYPDKDKDNYINNDQISLFPKEYREFMWELYDKYVTHLEENKLAHPDFTPLPIDPNEDIIIIIDECQQLSLMRIKNLIEKARGRVFIAINPDQNCNDDNISKLEFVKKTINLLLKKMLIKKNVEVFQLPYTYRLPENVLEAANIILLLTRFIYQGRTADGQQNEIASILCDQDIPGIVNWFNPSQVSLENLQKLTARADCAVVTLPEFVEEAKRELNTDNVFTPDQIVGLQFPYIISYKYFSGKQHYEMLKEISKLISETPDDVILGGNKTNRTKDHSKKSDAFWSRLYVLVSRASQSVIFYDDIPDLSNENKRKQENVLFHLYRFLVEHTATEEKIDLNNIKLDASTSKEAWLNLIKKYLAQGRIELAKNNFFRRVKGAVDEFEALKAGHAKVKVKPQVSVDVKINELVPTEEAKGEEIKTEEIKIMDPQENIIQEEQTIKVLTYEDTICAVQEGDATTVKKYLQNKIDLKKIKILLCNALQAGQIKIVELLLQHEPSLINLPLKDNKTPLYIAAEERQLLLVKFLLASGAEAYELKKPIQSKSKHKKTIKSLRPIDIAIENVDLEIIDSLLAQDLRLTTHLINSLVNKAAFKYFPHLIQSSNKNNPEKNIPRNTTIIELLNKVVKSGSTNIVKLFLTLEWEKSLSKAGLESFMLSLVEEAAQRGHGPILKMLLSFPPTKQNLIQAINTKVDQEKISSPVGNASANGHIDVVRILLKQGIKAGPNNNNEKSIQLAAKKGHKEIVKLLVKYGPQENIQNEEKITKTDQGSEKPEMKKTEVSESDVLPYATQLIETGDIVDFISSDYYQSMSDKSLAHLFFIAPFQVDTAYETVNMTIFESIFNDENKKKNFLNTCIMAATINDPFLLKLFSNEGIDDLEKIKACQFNIIQTLIENDVDVMNVIIKPALNLGHVGIIDTLFTCKGFDPDRALPISLVMDLNLLTSKALPLDKCITPLMVACHNGHLDLVKYLLQRHQIDPNARSVKGHSPLSLALENGHVDVVQCLLHAHADPNVQIDGVSLLEITLETENDECITLLEKYGAKDERKTVKPTSQNNEAKGPKSKTQQTQTSQPNNTLDVPPPILKTSPSIEVKSETVINKDDKSKLTPEINVSSNQEKTAPIADYELTVFQFKMAIKHGHHSVVKDILDTTKYVTELMNETIDEKINGNIVKMALIPCAADKGSTEVVEVLIEKSLKPLKRDELLQSLNMAAAKNNLKLTKLLLNHFKLDCNNFKDNFPLYYAAKKGHVEIVKVLIKHAINLSTLKEALFCAITERKIRVVEALLESNILIDTKSFINMPIKNNKTLLQIAIENQQEDMVKFLLDYGADPYAPPFDQPDLDSDSCLIKLLELAAISQNLKIMDMLLLKQSRINHVTLISLLKKLKYLDENGTELKKAQAISDLTETAAKNGYLQILRICLTRFMYNCNMDEMKAIIINSIASSAESGQAAAVEMLFKLKFVNKMEDARELKNEIIHHYNTENSINTPIYVASNHGFYDVVKVLLKHGVLAAPKNELNDTPLIYAVVSGNIKLVKLLIKNGADINVLADDGHGHLTSAFSVAVQKQDVDMVEFLLSQKNLNPNQIIGLNFGHVLHLAVDIACNNKNTRILEMLLKDDRVKRNISIKKFNLTPIAYAKKRGCSDEVIKLFETIKPSPQVYPANSLISLENQPSPTLEVDTHAYLRKIITEGNESDFIGSDFYRLLSDMKILDIFFLQPFILNPDGDQEEITITFRKYIFKDKAKEIKLLDKLLSLDSQNRLYLFKLFPNNLSEMVADLETKIFIEKEQMFLLSWLAEREDIMQAVLLPALCTGNVAIVNALIELNLFDPNVPLPLSILIKQKHSFSKGTTALMLASEKGQVEMVQFLLTKNTNVNSASAIDDSALYLAVKNKHSDVVKVLLQNDANIETTFNGESIIIYAVKNHDRKTVKLLLEKGVKTDVETVEKQPLIYLAIDEHQPGIIEDILFFDKDQNIENYDRGPFMSAINSGSLEIVNTFINHYEKNKIKIDNSDTYHLLAYAVRHGTAEIVNTFLEHNINCNFEETLKIAILQGQKSINIVDVILKFTDTLPDHECLLAAEIDNQLAVTACLKHLKQNDCQTTPLHLAIKYGRYDLVKTFLLKGANVNAKDHDDCTPLHYAVSLGQLESLKILLEDPSIKLDAMNVDKKSARDLAMDRNDDLGREMMECIDQKDQWKKKPQNQQLKHFEKNKGHQPHSKKKKKKPITDPKKNSSGNSYQNN
jgi:ankyrin repeat protein